MKAGDKVKVIRTENSFWRDVKWWPNDGMTGTVQKVFANGSVRVACHQLPNHSDDGMISKTFKAKDATFEVYEPA